MAGESWIEASRGYGDTSKYTALSKYLDLKKVFNDALRQHQWNLERDAIDAQKSRTSTAATLASQGGYSGADLNQFINTGQFPDTMQFQGKTSPYGLNSEQASSIGQALIDGTVVPSQLSRTQRTQAINEALKLDPNYNAAQSDINYAVNKTGSSNFEKLYNNVTSFEKTFRKNADVALQLSDSFDRSRIPLLNRAILAGKTTITGDPEASKLLTSIYTVATEYARLTSAPGATGSMITDSAREEARGLLNAYMNQGTLRGQLDPENGIMSIDARNRIQALDETRNDIQSRYSSKSYKQADPLGLR